MHEIESDFDDLRQYLKKQLNINECSPSGLDKYLKADWSKIYMSRKPNDEFWHWEKPSGTFGWCVVREGKIIDSICLMDVSSY